MGRPKKGYFAEDGKRVPGTTTVIPKWDVEGLLIWANREGQAGRDHRDTRDEAAIAGTMAHEIIEAFVKHEVYKPSEEVAQKILKLAEKAAEGFYRWAEMTKLEILETETSLVSERYRYGGTIDAIALVNGQCCLVDFKSGSIREEALVQTAAYRHLWNERNPKDPVFEAHILRVGKEHGDFNHKFVTSDMLDLCWAQFKNTCLDGYERHKKIRKMVG